MEAAARCDRTIWATAHLRRRLLDGQPRLGFRSGLHGRRRLSGQASDREGYQRRQLATWNICDIDHSCDFLFSGGPAAHIPIRQLPAHLRETSEVAAVLIFLSVKNQRSLAQLPGACSSLL